MLVIVWASFGKLRFNLKCENKYGFPGKSGRVLVQYLSGIAVLDPSVLQI